MFELAGEVLDTAVVHHIGNLAKGKLILVDQLLDPLYLIQNDIFFQGDLLTV
jgi:hypothetical protein